MEQRGVVSKVPSQESLENGLSFITNDILRANIAIAFRYIFFLLALEDAVELPGAISYSVYKDIILYTAAIVESCIHHCLRRYLDAGVVQSTDLMPSGWKDHACSVLYEIPNNGRVCGVVRHKTHERFTTKTQFQTLNRAAKEAGILTEELFRKAESLRKKRNRIHLAGLEETDDFYEKSDVGTAFRTAENIIGRVDQKLAELTT